MHRVYLGRISSPPTTQIKYTRSPYSLRSCMCVLMCDMIHFICNTVAGGVVAAVAERTPQIPHESTARARSIRIKLRAARRVLYFARSRAHKMYICASMESNRATFSRVNTRRRRAIIAPDLAHRPEHAGACVCVQRRRRRAIDDWVCARAVRMSSEQASSSKRICVCICVRVCLCMHRHKTHTHIGAQDQAAGKNMSAAT